MVACPICSKSVKPTDINAHIDSSCQSYIQETSPPPLTQQNGAWKPASTPKPSLSSFFQTPAAKKAAAYPTPKVEFSPIPNVKEEVVNGAVETPSGNKRPREDGRENGVKAEPDPEKKAVEEPPAKKSKTNVFQKVAPLADRMRPRTLDEVCGQELVGPSGVLRGLIEQDRVPSMILWGSAGTGKTTIARVIASMVGSRFVEINSTSSGVGECKKIFAEARGELGLSGRKTIVFCDEIST